MFTSNSRLMSKVNRREHDRRKASWDVEVTFSTGKKVLVKTVNVSESGIRINVPKMIDGSFRAYVKIDSFINGVKAIIDGVVEFKHCHLSGDKFQAGGEFLKISEKNKTLLHEYVKGLTPVKKEKLRALQASRYELEICEG